MSEKNVLPQGWGSTPLISVGDYLTGVTYKKADSSKEPRENFLPVLRANNINGKLNFDKLVYVPKEKIKDVQLIRQRDIVICMSSGSKHLVGKAAQAEQDFAGGFGAFCGLFRCATGIDPRFVGYFFHSPKYRRTVSKVSKGVNINNLRRAHIETMEIPVPPLPEQERIVTKIEELFTQLDAGVAELEQAKAQLKCYRQSVLKSAVEGELTREWRELQMGEIEPASQLLERILAERREKWDGRGKYKEPATPDTESLPKLPDSWIWAIVEQVTENFDAMRIPVRASDRKEMQGEYPYYGASGVIDQVDNFIFDGKYLLVAEDGANLVSRNTPIAFQAHGKFWVNNHAHILQMLGNCPLGYLEVFFNATNLQFSITGTAQPKLNQRNLNKIPIPIPPSDEQNHIMQMVERRLSVADEIEKELDEALVRSGRLRQAVLKSAFEGRLV